MPLLPLLALTLTAYPALGSLEPGSPAPALSVKKWLKGAPVTELRKDGTYVVEFWATWCGPCRESIPHLTEMAKRNKDVTFIGVSVWEDDQGGNIKGFVDKMGAKMDYHVGYSGNQDGMAKTWMKAAAQNGIPTAFVVKEGKVVWIGHPMELEEPLAQIKADTFDLKSFKAGFGQKVLAARAKEAASGEVQDADAQYAAGNRAAARAALARAVKADPNLAPAAARTRLGWLAKDDPKAWQAQARTLARSGMEDDMSALMQYALDAAEKPATVPLARRSVALALEAEPRGFAALYFGAKVYEATKDYGPALDLTRKLIAYFPTGQVGGDPDFMKELLRQKARLAPLVLAAKR